MLSGPPSGFCARPQRKGIPAAGAYEGVIELDTLNRYKCSSPSGNRSNSAKARRNSIGDVIKGAFTVIKDYSKRPKSPFLYKDDKMSRSATKRPEGNHGRAAQNTEVSTLSDSFENLLGSTSTPVLSEHKMLVKNDPKNRSIRWNNALEMPSEGGKGNSELASNATKYTVGSDTSSNTPISGPALLKLRVRNLASRRNARTKTRTGMFLSVCQTRVMWDVLMCICLVYILVFLPLEIAYDEPSSKIWTLLSYSVDVLFWLDIIVCFRTTYHDEDGIVVWDPSKCAWKYLRTYFFTDFFSCVPGFPLSALWDSGKGSSTAVVKLAKTSKVFRSLKLLKGLRVLKMFKVVNDLEQHLMVQAMVMRIMHMVSITTLFLHIDACAFSIVGRIQTGDIRDSWMGRFGFLHVSWDEEYQNALYWAATTTTTVGYGDISPQTSTERMFGIFSMLLGVGIYGYIIASMTDIVSNVSLEESKYLEKMETIKSFVTFNKLGPELGRKIYMYFSNFYQKRMAIDEHSIITSLPSNLQHELRLSMTKDKLDTPFFQSLDSKYFAEVLDLLKPMHVITDVIIMYAGKTPPPEMFVLIKGLVGVHKKTLNPEVLEGDLYSNIEAHTTGGAGGWGALDSLVKVLEPTVIFGSEGCFGLVERNRFTYKAIEPCDMFSINSDELLTKFKGNPSVMDKIRQRFFNTLTPEGGKRKTVRPGEVGKMRSGGKLWKLAKEKVKTLIKFNKWQDGSNIDTGEAAAVRRAYRGSITSTVTPLKPKGEHKTVPKGPKTLQEKKLAQLIKDHQASLEEYDFEKCETLMERIKDIKSKQQNQSDTKKASSALALWSKKSPSMSNRPPGMPKGL